ncbi:ABC transporter permease [Nocardioides cavernaquae]|uniref:ABC transporter permease n=1 Tax=Nocardioides cavernaquae TaxID=2321396 RepID=A0A3A5HCS4_9ACTN|nr:ABC transporter permease [Nocardioides cavernaquae]
MQRVLVDMGEAGRLLGYLVKTAVKEPRGYWTATRDEMYYMLQFCWLPVMLAVGGFSFLIANYAYDLVSLLGAGNRLGTYFVFASLREISPFATGMAVAGVMGTAMTADLGARKIREELDAFTVLGIDAVRILVLPRVIAITVMMVAFNIVGSLLGMSMAMISATWLGTTSPGAFLGNLLGSMTVPELVGTTVKCTLIGIFIGVISAQKGLNAKGGAEGVGRAVNEAVVLSFAAVWVFNFIVNATMLGLNPEMLISR